MTNYAYYRLPYSDSYTVIESDRKPQILSKLEDIGGVAGFIIAPFRGSPSCPIVLIHPDRIETISLQPQQAKEEASTNGHTAPSEEYKDAFEVFHTAVNKGEFHKLVLARESMLNVHSVKGEGYDEKKNVFLRACQMYPRLTIMLFSTVETGTWLIASPEILIEGQAGNYHTVALAGTMPYRDGYLDWSEKNKQEQHIVEEYIAETIAPLASGILKDGPVTMRAGNLAHLRTDFRFHLLPNNSIGAVISRLHPTPAICGLPKSEACRFILEHEGICRRYYSGFAGPVDINNETHLYVSLRCAEIHKNAATLYAGGGIMPDSTCQSEWQETEQKMKTIANVLE